MLSGFLGGIGDLVAPRPDSQRELMYLLRSGQADKAIALLRRARDSICRSSSPNSDGKPPQSDRSSDYYYDEISLGGISNGSVVAEDMIDVNLLDEDTGLAPLHYAAAIGSMELVMELLLCCAYVHLKSEPGGNTALHLAAMNSHSYVTELLLRFSADPAVPNDQGLIAVELTKDAATKEALLRRRGSLRLDKEMFVYGDVVSDSSLSTPSSMVSSIVASDMGSALHSGDVAHVMKNNTENRQAVNNFGNGNITETQATPNAATELSMSQAPGGENLQCDESDDRDLASSVLEFERQAANERVHLLLAGVQQAAIETAFCCKDLPDEAENKRVIFKACQEKSNSRLLDDITRLCTSDPGLVRCRACEMLNLASDGWTPLHAAARWGNVPAINLLLRGFPADSTGHDESDLSTRPFPRNAADPWALDLQGRTPLHLAAERGFLQACRVLRTAMQRPRRLPSIPTVSLPHAGVVLIENEIITGGCDPVGVDAPVDLTGTTPLGWVGRRGAKVLDADVAPHAEAIGDKPSASATPGSKRNPIAIQAANPLEVEFFSPGDASVLPKTPSAFRCGSVKRKASTPGTRKSVMFSPSPIKSTKEVFEEVPVPESAAPRSATLSDVNRGQLHGGGEGGLGVVFGFSEASGWRNTMEDRIIAKTAICDAEEDLLDFSELFSEFDDEFLSSILQTELDMKQWSLFAVFDGHGGDFSSSFASITLSDVMIEQANEKLRSLTESILKNKSRAQEHLCSFYEDLMKDAFIRTDSLLAAQPRMSIKLTAKGNFQMRDHSGSTCILVLLTPNHVVVSNLGDSRAVMGLKCADGSFSTQPLSFDHKPMNPIEKERIERTSCSIHHVSGDVYEVACEKSKQRLRMSRSFGDFYLKQSRDSSSASDSHSLLHPRDQAVSCVPEVIVMHRNESESFIILACDGIWDVMSNEEAVKLVGDFVSNSPENRPTGDSQDSPSIGALTGGRVAACCDELLLRCLQKGSRDNMSALVLALPGCPDVAPWRERAENGPSSVGKDADVSLISDSFSSLSLRTPPIGGPTHSPHASSGQSRLSGAATPRALNNSIASASTYMESPDVNTSGASIRIMDVSNEDEDDVPDSPAYGSGLKLAAQRLFDAKADA